MKEHIYTIPVTDGFTQGGECPFCNMRSTLERASIEYTLGPSYMEDDIRMETDKIGFCDKHFNDMYAEQNRLGLALMTYTHLVKINSDLSEAAKSLREPQTVKKGFFQKNTSKENTGVKKAIDVVNAATENCFVCDRINKTFTRYVDTYFHMWVKKPEIKQFTKESKGFCISHFALLLNEANKLDTNSYDEFLSIVVPLQMENLKRLEDELDWFIKKFDYRFTNDPWKNSKDALPRTINKISQSAIQL